LLSTILSFCRTKIYEKLYLLYHFAVLNRVYNAVGAEMIFFITQRDSFFIDSFFETFDKFGKKYTIINLPNFNKGFTRAVKRTYNLYGFNGFIFFNKVSLLDASGGVVSAVNTKIPLCNFL